MTEGDVNIDDLLKELEEAEAKDAEASSYLSELFGPSRLRYDQSCLVRFLPAGAVRRVLSCITPQVAVECVQRASK